jgi:hypothetical protein
MADDLQPVEQDPDPNEFEKRLDDAKNSLPVEERLEKYRDLHRRRMATRFCEEKKVSFTDRMEADLHWLYALEDAMRKDDPESTGQAADPYRFAAHLDAVRRSYPIHERMEKYRRLHMQRMAIRIRDETDTFTTQGARARIEGDLQWLRDLIEAMSRTNYLLIFCSDRHSIPFRQRFFLTIIKYGYLVEAEDALDQQNAVRQVLRSADADDNFWFDVDRTAHPDVRPMLHQAFPSRVSASEFSGASPAA